MIVCENIDSLRKIPWIPDNHYDFVIDDSEYGIGESKKNHASRNTPVKQKNGKSLQIKDPDYKKKDWDQAMPDRQYFSDLKRISKNQIIFGANYFPYFFWEPFKPLRRNQYKEFLEKNPKGWIIWDKINGENDFSDCEMIWTSLDFNSYVVYYLWAGMMQGEKVSKNVSIAKRQIGNKKDNEKRFHPTQKPVIFYKYLLFSHVNKGSYIADFKGGALSAAMAVLDLNREHDYRLTLEIHEKETDYFQYGMKRLGYSHEIILLEL